MVPIPSQLNPVHALTSYCSRAHPASYSIGIGGAFPWDKVAKA
jgi:hypothetical protein